MITSKKTGIFLTDGSASRRLITLIASCLGIGYLKKAPNILGSLPGIAIFMLTRNQETEAQIIFFFCFVLFSIGIIEHFERNEQRKDPEEAVLDEAVGMWSALLFIWDASLLTILAAFLIFRLLDSLKPFPINLLQTFSGGIGVMADSLASGMITNMIIRMLLIQNVL